MKGTEMKSISQIIRELAEFSYSVLVVGNGTYDITDNFGRTSKGQSEQDLRRVHDSFDEC